MATHRYVAERAKSFSTRLTIELEDDKTKDVQVCFEDGQYMTEDDVIGEAIDAAITRVRGSLGRFICKVDKDAAVRLAAEFLARQRRAGGVKGQLSALDAQNAMRQEINQRDETLKTTGADLSKLAEESEIMLTEPVNLQRKPVASPLAEEDKLPPATTFKLGD